MKIALVTTTINVPRVLELYRAYGPDVMFFIAGDRKSPDLKITDFLADIPNHAYYGIDWQHKLGYRCSQVIGENCIQRRNIALLEAVKWGAEVIVSCDDDNIPLDGNYFTAFDYACGGVFSGLKAESPDGWFDVGKLLQPVASHRGFPHNKTAQPSFTHVVGARVGVAAGMCLGDPDISAVTRIANGPIVHGTSALLQSGIVVDPNDTWTIFNSQNTAFIRELAPAFFMMPGVGRYDDIYASLIMQKIMRERKLHVHHGKPFVWQQRNSHDLVKDLEMELNGMRNIERFARFLDSLVLAPGSVVNQVRQIYQAFDHVPHSYDLVPEQAVKAALAFCDDIEALL